jgi:nucleotidyltransferase/DNA polymerase involved in DNA repair
MDAFFAAIEQRDNPTYRNKPVIIGADPKEGKGRGVVSTCSYEARKYGIHSAMPISIAYKKCPQGIFLRGNMAKYAQVSDEIYDIFCEFTPKVEPVSIDEAFLDITGSFHLFKTPRNTCIELKRKIKAETDLTASVGMAPTKMVAKIASDLEKPDGLVEVKKEKILEFLRPLDIQKLWGLGPKTAQSLRSLGINTIGDLAKQSKSKMDEMFGEHGLHLWELAQGIDEREVEADDEVKSVGNEITFPEDTDDDSIIETALMRLCEKVSLRLRKDELKGRTITLKIRTQGFNTFTRAITISSATNFVDSIFKAIKKLYKNFDSRGKKIRLVGVKVSNLMPQDEIDSIFETGITEKKTEKMHQAVEKIKDKFGYRAISRARSFKKKI